MSLIALICCAKTDNQSTTELLRSLFAYGLPYSFADTPSLYRSNCVAITDK
jgi:hypothetical protein